MISLKQHNDLVQTLLKQISSKQSQINNLTKQINKQFKQQPQLQPTQAQQALTKRINQINKQHKERISTITQQLRSKSNEVKDLKERLVIQKNIQNKQKTQINEMFKKSFERKPSTPHDYKVAALIAHYEEEINRKNGFIKNLQKQLKEHQSKEQGNLKQKDQNIQQEIKGISLHKHQAQINKIQIQLSKYKKICQQKTKEYKQLHKKYEQLTKDYYKILNQYNDQPQKTSKFKIIHNNKSLNNILHQVCQQQQECPQHTQLSYSFQSNVTKFNQTPIVNMQRSTLDSSTNQLDRIFKMFNLQQNQQLIPYLLKIQSKIEQVKTYDKIVQSVQDLLKKLGMGKVPLSQLSQKIQEYTDKLNNMLEAIDLLDQLCIQAGAKREKLLDKIKDLKATQQEYFKNMKNIKFVKQIPKANKVIQFIDYFELSDEQIVLPEQLKHIYEQLKYVNKFMKQAKSILQFDNNGIQQCMETILRHLEKYRASLLQIPSQAIKQKVKITQMH